MTDRIIAQPANVLAEVLHMLIARLAAWLNEEVAETSVPFAEPQFSRSDWADLPTYHPSREAIRGDRDGR